MSTLARRVDARLLPFTREHFTAWVRLQPPEQEYHFWDCEGGCAMGRYMRAHGRSWWDVNCGYVRSCEEVFGDALDETLRAHPHTFGALAQRLAGSE